MFTIFDTEYMNNGNEDFMFNLNNRLLYEIT